MTVVTRTEYWFAFLFLNQPAHHHGSSGTAESPAHLTWTSAWQPSRSQSSTSSGPRPAPNVVLAQTTQTSAWEVMCTCAC